MVKINEWLPNPSGSDGENEWLELYNDSNQVINLNDWTIVSGKKAYKIKSQIIEPFGFLVLKRNETKLTLLNQNGELKLYDLGEKLIDTARFFGQAPEGKSFSRFENYFIFTNPTPGAKNINLETAQIINNFYPQNLALNKIYDFKEIFIANILIGIFISAVVWYIIKNNENLQDLFFK